MIKRIIVLVLMFTAFACSNHRLDKQAEEITNYLIENKDNIHFTLDLSTISSFKWDEIIVVGPYVDLDRVSNDIGYDFSRFPKTIKSHDKFVLIGFIDNKIGVKYLEIDRYLLSDNIFNGIGKNYRIYSRENSNIEIIK